MGNAGMGSSLQDSDSKPMEISSVMGDSVTNTFMMPTCKINGVNVGHNGAESSKAKKKLDYVAFNEEFPLKTDLNGKFNDSSMGLVQSVDFFPSQSSAVDNSFKSQELMKGGPAFYSLTDQNQKFEGKEK